MEVVAIVGLIENVGDSELTRIVEGLNINCKYSKISITTLIISIHPLRIGILGNSWRCHIVRNTIPYCLSFIYKVSWTKTLTDTHCFKLIYFIIELHIRIICTQSRNVCLKSVQITVKVIEKARTCKISCLHIKTNILLISITSDNTQEFSCSLKVGIYINVASGVW